jgi:group II intron reverse transcriptase/maturase
MARQKQLPFPEDETPLQGTGLAGGDTRNVSGPVEVSQAVPASRNDTETTGSSLFDEVLRRETLNRAWAQVRANKGAPGVDGVTIDEFVAWMHEHRERVLAALRDGSYQPSPVRRKDIPKAGGGTRMLGVPTVLDRVIQQAIVIVLTPILDPTFSQSSFGFRPRKSAHDAVRQARGFVQAGYRWVVDLDLSKFFDRVNHDVLMERLARRINDKRLLRLIRRYLEAGMMVNGVVTEREEGTPQGGPLSPLLANVLLDEWDQQLEARGHKFCRYADDCNVYVQSRRAGERVMAWCVAFLEGRLRLKVNVEKSAVDRPWRRKFLGLSVSHGQTPKIRIAPQSKVRFADRVRQITSRRRGISLDRMVRELNQYLRGWFGYFRLSETPSVLEELDGWIRRRLRCYLLKQWKPGRGRRKALQRLNVPDPWMISSSRKGPWRLSKTKAVHLGLDQTYFDQLGLFNLTAQWRAKSQPI